MPLVSRVLTVNTVGGMFMRGCSDLFVRFLAKILYSRTDYSSGQLSQLQELDILSKRTSWSTSFFALHFNRLHLKALKMDDGLAAGRFNLLALKWCKFGMSVCSVLIQTESD